MADHYSGFTVIMESDIDEEKMKKVLATLEMVKGVIDVKPVERAKTETTIAKSRLKAEIVKKFIEAVKEV